MHNSRILWHPQKALVDSEHMSHTMDNALNPYAMIPKIHRQNHEDHHWFGIALACNFWS